nr:hypothetical protein [Micromonospora sp. DSM 115978]
MTGWLPHRSPDRDGGAREAVAAIELGEMPAAAAPVRGPAGPPTIRRPATHRGRWSVRRPARSWLGAALGTLLVMAVADAPLPGPPAESAVPARLGAVTFAAEGRLFVADPRVDATPSDRWLAAFRLPDAAPLWRIPMPLAGPLGTALVVDRTLVLTVDWSSVVGRETVGVDVGTGRVRWWREATLEGVTAGGDLLLWTAPWTASVTDNPAGTLRAVEPTDARARWTLPLPAGALHSYRYQRGPAGDPGEADRVADRSGPVRAEALVVSSRRGRVEIRDLSAGRVVRAADLPPRGPPGDRLLPRVAGDLLLVDDGLRTVTAYGLDRLDRRWQMTVDLGREFGPSPCGAGLCLYGRHGGVRVADPATGRTRWTDSRWDTLVRVGDGLLASRLDRSGPARLAVLDPATGEVRGELGAWQVVRTSAEPGRLTGVRVGADGTAWVADLDPVTVTARLRERLSGVSGGCEAGADVLICRRLDGSIGLWQV